MRRTRSRRYELFIGTSVGGQITNYLRKRTICKNYLTRRKRTRKCEKAHKDTTKTSGTRKDLPRQGRKNEEGTDSVRN